MDSILDHISRNKKYILTFPPTNEQQIQHPKLERRISFVRSSVRPFVLRHARTTPPENLKRAGLESSGRRLISSIGKTKRIAF